MLSNVVIISYMEKKTQQFAVTNLHIFRPLRLNVKQVHSISCTPPEILYNSTCIFHRINIDMTFKCQVQNGYLSLLLWFSSFFQSSFTSFVTISGLLIWICLTAVNISISLSICSCCRTLCKTQNTPTASAPSLKLMKNMCKVLPLFSLTYYKKRYLFRSFGFL